MRVKTLDGNFTIRIAASFENFKLKQVIKLA